jgi:ANTAR domain/GAF domain
MSDEREPNGNQWTADQRDFVADHRDEVADSRERLADEREQLADEREQLADERERLADEREPDRQSQAVRPGHSPPETKFEGATSRAERAATACQRASAEKDRAAAADERGAATTARDKATRQRHASTPTTGLAIAFAEIARHLYEADDLDEILTRIAETALTAISGCDSSSVTLKGEEGTYDTAAATSETAIAVDRLQYAAEEGPCLDAVEEALVYSSSLPDPRWPKLGSSPAESGVRSIASYRLAASTVLVDAPLAGSLNTYAGVVNAFDEEAREIGVILAAHASLAIRATSERESFQGLARQLYEAVSSRDVIGQAKGILMERLRITPEEAFDVLRRSSQALNVKLREVARQLSETGEMDGAAPG